MDPVGTPPSDFVGCWRHLANEMTIAVRVGALLLLAPAACAMAQSMEPRACANVPVGLNFLVVAYGYSQSEVAC